MSFTIRIVYPDGWFLDRPDMFADRAAAIGHALSLAEDLGRSFAGGDRGPAQWVSIYLDGKLDISIQVIRGGLSGRPGHEGLIDSDRQVFGKP